MKLYIVLVAVMFLLTFTGCGHTANPAMEIDAPTYQALTPEGQKQYLPSTNPGKWVLDPSAPKTGKENGQAALNSKQIQYGHWEDWGVILVVLGIIYVMCCQALDTMTGLDFPPLYGGASIVGGISLGVYAQLSGQVAIFLNSFGQWIIGGLFILIGIGVVYAVVKIVKDAMTPPRTLLALVSPWHREVTNVSTTAGFTPNKAGA